MSKRFALSTCAQLYFNAQQHLFWIYECSKNEFVQYLLFTVTTYLCLSPLLASGNSMLSSFSVLALTYFALRPWYNSSQFSATCRAIKLLAWHASFLMNKCIMVCCMHAFLMNKCIMHTWCTLSLWITLKKPCSERHAQLSVRRCASLTRFRENPAIDRNPEEKG